MKRYQLIEKIVADLEKFDDSLSEAREEHRDQWELYSERLRECSSTREAMRKHLTLLNTEGEKLAHYFEDSLMFESKIIQDQKEVALLRAWLDYMNEEVEKP